MMQDWIASLVVETHGLVWTFIELGIPFKRAALAVADQVTNASVISKDCRIVSEKVTSMSQIVTCFNAAKHKRMTVMMMAGKIVLLKTMHN